MILGILACFGSKKEVTSIRQEQSYVWQAPLEQEHPMVKAVKALEKALHTNSYSDSPRSVTTPPPSKSGFWCGELGLWRVVA